MKKVNIYSPTYYRYGKTRKALESIIESVKSSENDVNLFIGDNNTKHVEMHSWLDTISKIENVKVFKSGTNIGKAALINYMFKNTRECDYFISIDSDMLADENDQYNWIDELVKLKEHGPANNFGIFSTWQKENNAHMLDKQTESTEFLGHEIVYGTPWGVAGGCLIMSSGDFKEIGCYNIMDIYNGDDALLMRNVSNKLNKLIGITKTIRLVHQHNEDYELEYQQWKIDKCHGKIEAGNVGFWD